MADQALEEGDFAAVDLETTGLRPGSDEIVAIAIIPMKGYRILLGSAFHTLVKPGRLDGKSIKFHGICPRDLEGAPSFEEVSGKVRAILEGKTMIGYATDFDRAFLVERYKKLGRIADPMPSFDRGIDIARVEAWLLRREGIPVPRRIGFEDLLERYRLNPASRHDALSDAYLAASIFQRQLKRASERGATIQELKDLRDPDLQF
ncbi:MAG: exonuclease domain-containing protein [Candidatus Methanosuratincola sp.]|jgi:DNA polymerase-3 subunit epsilon|nr:3'-5' exonuclease [Candidatus Methanosuratincola sp.]